MENTALTPLTADEIDALDELDLERLDEAELKCLYERVRLTYPILEAEEPEDEDSEAYQLWQESLETLDDYLDELTERLA